MLEQTEAKRSYVWKLPAVLATIIVVVAAIQLFRVNKPTEEPEAIPLFTQAGPLVTGDLVVPAGDYYAKRIELNRRSKLIGEFTTGKNNLRISVLVLPENEFEKWKAGEDPNAIIKTGSVPAGKISPSFGPGVFYLVVSNREGDVDRSVQSNFELER